MIYWMTLLVNYPKTYSVFVDYVLKNLCDLISIVNRYKLNKDQKIMR